MAGTYGGICLPDTQLIRRNIRELLVEKLESVNGMKDLVLDVELMKPLDRIAGASLLKEHNVDKIFKLESSKPLHGCNQRIYLVRARPAMVKYIADQINAERSSDCRRSYKILLVPRKLHSCELILEHEGVYGYVTVEEFPLDFVTLDVDILSLESPKFFRSFYLDGDQTGCHQIARSVVHIQQYFGTIPNVYCMGRCAQMVHSLMKTMTDGSGETSTLRSEIGHLFLVDRDCDLVTPLCSQVTYEGLLDDTFTISSGFIELDPEVTNTDKSVKLLLTSQDPIFEEIRNRHFSNVSVFLSSKAKELQIGYDKRHNLSSVNDMKNFVANDLKDLKQQHKSLSHHVGACEAISSRKTKNEFEKILHTEHSLLEGSDLKECVNDIEEIIDRQCNMMTCLRLLCLMSVTQGGIPSPTYKSLKTQFVQSFGYDQILTLYNLKRVGLLVEAGQSQAAKHLGKVASVVNIPLQSSFRSICRKLNLIPKSAEEVNLRTPMDMSYVFSGAYTPLLCKIIEQVLIQESFAGMDELMKMIGAPFSLETKAKSVKGCTVLDRAGNGLGLKFVGKAGGTSQQVSASARIVMVYFLGGCTFSEIAALRFLAKHRGYKIMIATTSIINGVSFLDSVLDKHLIT